MRSAAIEHHDAVKGSEGMIAHPTKAPHQRQQSAPCDRHVSSKLDQLITALDESPPRLRRHILRAHKRWLEHHIPPFYEADDLTSLRRVR